MKPLIVLLLSSLSWAQYVTTTFNPGSVSSCGTTAPTLSQNISFFAGTSAFTTTQIGLPDTAGNAYVAVAEAVTGSGLSISDTCGASTNYDTWTNLVNAASDGNGGVWSAWVAYNIKACNSGGSGVTTTITATGGGTVYTSFGEFTGFKTSGFDQGPATAAGLTSGSVTTSCAHEMQVGVTVGGNGGTAPVAAGGSTLIANTNTGSRNPGWEYKVLSSTGSVSSSFTSGTGTLETSVLTFETSP